MTNDNARTHEEDLEIVTLQERLDEGSPRGPNLRLYHPEHGGRNMLVWCIEEKVIGANDNEPIWAIEKAQSEGWDVVYNMEDYDPPERIASYLDADSPPHRRLKHDE